MVNKRKKIPKSAKRVFKGEIYEVWQWPQKMFDGSAATFEIKNIKNFSSCFLENS